MVLYVFWLLIADIKNDNTVSNLFYLGGCPPITPPITFRWISSVFYINSHMNNKCYCFILVPKLYDLFSLDLY